MRIKISIKGEYAAIRSYPMAIRRAVQTGPHALTPSERRIAELAAQRATNRQIAQQLFVTPKTVELHLSSVFRKLGISTRTNLAAALAA